MLIEFSTEELPEKSNLKSTEDVARWLATVIQGWEAQTREDAWGFVVAVTIAGVEFILAVFEKIAAVNDNPAVWQIGFFRVGEIPWWKALEEDSIESAPAEYGEELIHCLCANHVRAWAV